MLSRPNVGESALTAIKATRTTLARCQPTGNAFDPLLPGRGNLGRADPPDPVPTRGRSETLPGRLGRPAENRPKVRRNLGLGPSFKHLDRALAID